LSKERPRKTEKRNCGRSKIVANTPDKRLLKSQKVKNGMVKYSGKTQKKSVKKRLIIADSSEVEPEDVIYVELNDDDCATLFQKQTVSIAEEMAGSTAVGHLVYRNFVSVKLAGKLSIFHYVTDVMNDYDGYQILKANRKQQKMYS
jgi:hypothetical protein